MKYIPDQEIPKPFTVKIVVPKPVHCVPFVEYATEFNAP